MPDVNQMVSKEDQVATKAVSAQLKGHRKCWSLKGM